MEVTIKNLGLIRETTLDLKPLTVIIGPNNSNKTYVAYCVHGLLSSIRATVARGIVANDKNQWQIRTTGTSWSLELDGAFFENLNKEVNRATTAFQRNLSEYFRDSTGKLFAQTKLSVKISDAEIKNGIAKSSYLFGQYSVGPQIYAVSLDSYNFVISVNEVVRPSTAKEELRSSPDGEVRSILRHVISRGAFHDSFLLPAERNALILSYKSIRDYRSVQSGGPLGAGKRGTEDSADGSQVAFADAPTYYMYPQPVEDFLRFLITTENAPEPPHLQGPFANMADEIEKHLQSGNRTVYRKFGTSGRELAVVLDKELTIDLYNASSSIKQLAPLVVYLKRKARPNDLVIIDEPEMNLHPESQAKLLEIIAMMVNSGIHVVLTTHSSYVMAHLNILCQPTLAAPEIRARQAEFLYLKNADAFLSLDDVSAYEMIDYKLTPLRDPDYRISWGSLNDVAIEQHERLFAIANECHE
ncbi:MAG: AAA family ATPase [Capsulimonadaceae bacterium]